MSRPDKKQRHKAKREAKRRESRRLASVSPIKKLAEAPGTVECWISQGFEDFNQTQIFVYKRAAGLSGIAAFLVDRGVVGLKDAWTRLDIDRAEFQEMLDASADRGIAMRRGTIDEVRRFVAGGARWAHDNGMRLPKDWLKTASFMGGVGDWQSADVSGFRKEFTGHPEDLRRRLLREPFVSYIRRPDVQFIFGQDAPYLDEETGEYVRPGDLAEFDEDDELDDDEFLSLADGIPEEEFDKLSERITDAASVLAAETARWLAALDRSPSIGLLQAWRSVIFSSMLARISMPNESQEQVAALSVELLDKSNGLIEEELREEHDRAIEQVFEHLEIEPSLMQRVMVEHGHDDDAPGQDQYPRPVT